MNCANCGQEIRETEPRDGIEMFNGEPEFRWVHEDGNPFCDGTFIATPGPGPVMGYIVDGKTWHPSDVRIVRREAP